VIPLPESNFDPESRIYARSAGDDKSNVMTLLVALEAIRAAGIRTEPTADCARYDNLRQRREDANWSDIRSSTP